MYEFMITFLSSRFEFYIPEIYIYIFQLLAREKFGARIFRRVREGKKK